MRRLGKRNWFPTLNEALESEGLLETWDGSSMPPIPYDSERHYTHEDGTRYGHFISITRDNCGLYERPVHYSRN